VFACLPSSQSRFVLTSFPTFQVYSFNVPTFGPGVVYDVDQKVRTEQFRWFTEALKKERLKFYVPQFVMEAEVGATCLPSMHTRQEPAGVVHLPLRTNRHHLVYAKQGRKVSCSQLQLVA